MKLSHLSCFYKDNSGTSIIEAALILPIALLLFVGVIDFGRAYYTLATSQKSVRAAVRYLSTLPASGLCITAGTPAGWGVLKAKNLAVYGNVDGTGTMRLDSWTVANISVSSSTCPVSTGATVRIVATVPFRPLVWQYAGLPSSFTMRVNYEAKWIGQ